MPHSWEITATKARALRFISGGKTQFAKRVTHPAIAIRSFMASSLAEMTPEIREELQRALDAELAED